jgi:hypothetical protein
MPEKEHVSIADIRARQLFVTGRLADIEKYEPFQGTVSEAIALLKDALISEENSSLQKVFRSYELKKNNH